MFEGVVASFIVLGISYAVYFLGACSKRIVITRILKNELINNNSLSKNSKGLLSMEVDNNSGHVIEITSIVVVKNDVEHILSSPINIAPYSKQNLELQITCSDIVQAVIINCLLPPLIPTLGKKLKSISLYHDGKNWLDVLNRWKKILSGENQ